jgi:glycosyltransferase involved in cell wall biosynthesis
MAAVVRELLVSPLAERYTLEVVPTYRGPDPITRVRVFCVALLRLTSWSLRRRGRIVHVHATVRGSLYRKSVCVLLARALKRRVVLHVHSGAGDIAAFRDGRGRLSLMLFRSAFAAADTVLAVSAASADALGRAYELTSIAVVPNAAPPVVEVGRKRDRSHVGVVYLGGFANAAKGGDVLLEALAMAIEREPMLRVTLAGPGELPAAGRALVGRGDAVRWAGWLEARDKDERMCGAEVFVLPSRSEGLPIALLEAMAYGLACVATRVGGVPEVMSDEREGLVVEPEHPEALADGLCRLAGDPELRLRLSEAARDAARRLDPAVIADRLDAIYAALR